MRIHILRLGAFARAVHDEAALLLVDEGHEVTGADAAVLPNAAPAFWPASDLQVLVAGRPAQFLERQLDRHAVEARTPVATVVLEHPRLRLGPVVDGTAACLGCLHTRRAQHDSTQAKTLPLLQAYDSDPTLEPGGYLPHHVSLAVTWLSDVAQAVEEGRTGRYAGRVGYVNLHTGAVSSDRVVGVHGCPRCRTTPPLAESSWLSLSVDLVGVGGGLRG